MIWCRHVEDMVGFMQSLDVFVLPTSYGEGVPKSLIEAAACGLPLVASNVAGCKEVIEHGVEGLLIPPNDVEALYDAIEFLRVNLEVRLAMGKAARQKALAVFDVQKINDQTIALYGL